MARLAPVLEIVTIVIDLLSILVLLWGVILCGKNFFYSIWVQRKKGVRPAQKEIMSAKIELGRYVLLGLEILIVADIIDSIVNPTVGDIFRLAAIVAIRTVISYFLNREIQETNQELAESEKESPV